MAVSDIRFRRLGYVALNVTDLGRSTAFYTGIVGLEAAMAANGDVLLRCSDRRVDVMLTSAADPGLKRIGWQMESSKALATEADARQTNYEGVNLDEELVLMTTYQQAFNASARLIQAAREMYDTLLGMI